ncbi:probable glucan endo-1,3-beta-glucosidase BG4 [Humulus lupulus]|uniref:probable glucan endo-1,3-beta-glucosidase BG4 n=1 Tax=Humulus lupulus TaxID=3486 RepID=UPI002B41632A|nr:probable glucan endo-1,3-beta-glucosidase BG4 [Humulus lupulus]
MATVVLLSQLLLAKTALLLSIIVIIFNQFGEAKDIDIGVNYGMQGNNLPPAADVINLYKQNGVTKLRLFDPVPAALEALRGSQIEVTLDLRNQDLPIFASSRPALDQWFAQNVEPYLNDIQFPYLVVANEVIPGDLGRYVLPVMESLQDILNSKNLHGIKISTTIPGSALSTSYPPSLGQFSPQAAADIKGVLSFLSQQGSPLMINVYPYFAYASDPLNVRLDYAQFTATDVVVQDGPYGYRNLFDAMVDSFVAAMEVEGVSDVDLVVSESGWPSAGNGQYTTNDLASTYNTNFIKHITSGVGTPRRPNKYMEGFVFAMFNENLKTEGVEQNFGLFNPDMSPVYPVFDNL